MTWPMGSMHPGVCLFQKGQPYLTEIQRPASLIKVTAISKNKQKMHGKVKEPQILNWNFKFKVEEHIT